LRAIAFAVAALLFVTAAGPLRAQTLSFDIVHPSLGQFGFRNLWNITLRNPTLDAWQVYFHVEASDVKTGPVFAANSQEFRLAPGERTLSAPDVKLSDVWCEKGFEGFTASGKTLPEGDYTYDITLVPEMLKTSLLLRMRAPKPVEPLWPPDKATLADPRPAFVWNAPVVAGFYGSFIYALRVVKQKPGQTADAALQANQPVFDDCRVSTTACRPLATGLGLAPGKTYAWRVQAWDANSVSVDTASTQSRASSFVYRPGSTRPGPQAAFDYPAAGQPVSGSTSISVRSELPDAQLCLLEYALGSDSARGEWQVVGCLARTQDRFMTTWDADLAVRTAGAAYGTPCALRATILGAKGEQSETLLQTIVNEPPARTRRGCGCGR